MDKKTLEYVIKLRDQASAGFKRIGATAGSTMRSVKNAIFSVKSALVGVAAYLIGRYVRSWVEAAKKQEDAIQRVIAMAKAQGMAYAGLRKEVEKVTGALQAKTTYGDEEQIEAMAKMQAAGLSVAKALKALPLVLDVAASSGKAVGVAAEYMARGMLGNVTMLKRLFPEMYKWNEEQMTWANVQKYLTENIKGTAEELAKTPFGMMKQIADLWGDIKEKFGAFIAEWLANTGVLDAMKSILTSIGTALGGMATNTESNIEPSKQLGIALLDMSLAVITLGEALTAVGEKVKEHWGWISKILEASYHLIPGLEYSIVLFDLVAKKSNVGEAVTTWEKMRKEVELTAHILQYGFTGPMEEIADNLAPDGKVGSAVAILPRAVDGIGLAYQRSGDMAIEAGGKWAEIAKRAKAAADQVAANWGKGAKDIKEDFSAVAGLINNMSGWMANTFTTAIFDMGKKAKITFGMIAKAFAKMIFQMMIQLAALKIMKIALGGPLGMLLGGGGIVKAQHGVIVNQPTMIRHNVMAGEAGAEAVVPLTPEGLLKFAKGMININVHSADPGTWVDVVIDDVRAMDKLGEGVREWNISYAQR